MLNGLGIPPVGVIFVSFANRLLPYPHQIGSPSFRSIVGHRFLSYARLAPADVSKQDILMLRVLALYSSGETLSEFLYLEA